MTEILLRASLFLFTVSFDVYFDNVNIPLILSAVAANSALLKHLQEAGLLTEVSSLLVRAKSRDEAQLKKIQQQAKGTFTRCFHDSVSGHTGVGKLIVNAVCAF